MITVFNAQNYAQQWFFDKAYAILAAKGKLNDQELKYERFLSLDGYFAHMSDLIEIEPSYVLIPSDEEPFVIDANARTITIPAAFNKCAGVVGDNMCEIVTFTIDRYFDYVDLATANICIQWEANGRKGISHVSLIDLGTVSGKIRFGWPLTKELTGAPGIVKFAVRFFIKDKDTDKFVYLLNTLSTSITIKDGLNIENPEVTEDTIHDLFGKFVQNTENPTYPKPAPVYYDSQIGINLPEQAKINEQDTLVLEAQALVSDNGHINYQWYFKENATPANKEARYVPATGWDVNEKYYIYDPVDKVYVRAYPMTEAEYNKTVHYVYEELLGTPLFDSDPRFKIEEVYVEIDTPKERKGAEQYFEKLDTGAFKLIVDKELPHDVQLYERISRLTIVPTNMVDEGGDPKAITGMYWVGASNYVGADKYEIDNPDYPVEGKIYAINHTPEINSKYCYVPTPSNVIITDNLPQDLFMDKLEDGTLKGTLTLELQEDTGLPKRTYSWYRNDTEEKINVDAEGIFQDEAVDSGIDMKTLTITDPAKTGWYYAHVDSELNRAVTDNTSAICRVIEHTKAPVLKKMEFARWVDSIGTEQAEIDAYFADDANWTVIYDFEQPDKAIDMDYGVAERGDILRLRITTDLDDAKLNRTGLLADKIEYKWNVITPDATREMNLQDIDPTGNGLIPHEARYKKLGGREIDIRCLQNNVEYSFFCVVENTLAGEKNSLEQTDYKVVFKVW